jgi:hypothetical protein
MTSQPISSNHYSHDLQLQDAMGYLEREHPGTYRGLLTEFPEWADRVWSGSWLDTDAMAVDVEWSSWLTDAVEATGLVMWEEGEPWTDALRAAEDD